MLRLPMQHARIIAEGSGAGGGDGGGGERCDQVGEQRSRAAPPIVVAGIAMDVRLAELATISRIVR